MVHSALGGSIEAQGAEVLVQAQNRQYVDVGAASLAGGISAAGGSGASIIFKSETTAELLSQTTVTAAGLTVTAQSEETITGAVAAAAGWQRCRLQLLVSHCGKCRDKGPDRKQLYHQPDRQSDSSGERSGYHSA